MSWNVPSWGKDLLIVNTNAKTFFRWADQLFCNPLQRCHLSTWVSCRRKSTTRSLVEKLVLANSKEATERRIICPFWRDHMDKGPAMHVMMSPCTVNNTSMYPPFSIQEMRIPKNQLTIYIWLKGPKLYMIARYWRVLEVLFTVYSKHFCDTCMLIRKAIGQSCMWLSCDKFSTIKLCICQTNHVLYISRLLEFDTM